MLLIYLCLYLSIFPGAAFAKPIKASSLTAPASGTLPVLSSGQTQSGWSTSQDDSTHYLQVNQTKTKVTIEWDSFDIGSNASVHFEQPSSGTALNRIYDSSPSQIYGKLTATGNIYLINQNGIVFGEGSRVNVNSLVASALNISDEDFTDSDGNLWHFTAENYQNSSGYEYSGVGDVTNNGTLVSDSEGRIFLLGSTVVNSGTISAEGGWIVLSAGTEFEVTSSVNTSGYLIENISTDYSGDVTNTSDGEILGDKGDIGIYGKIIRHNGLIRSLSTVREGGEVKLVASKKITTGKNSSINMGVEELDDEELVENPFSGRDLTFESADGDTGILIAHYGDITMPSGDVTMDAGEGGRVYLGDGSTIDVSGSWSTKEMAELVASIQLNSIELRDEFNQKNGNLKGETVYYLLNEGVSIGNISEALESRILSALEESAQGGTVTLSAGTGDIIVDEGASIDISGGGVTYNGGWVTTTKLVSNGVVYDISEAPDNLEYDQVIYDTKNYQEYINTFKEGEDAGSLSITAQQIVYEGSLDASAVQGTYQVNETDPTDDLGYTTCVGTVIPSGGTLTIGASATATDEYYIYNDPVVQAIVIKDTTSGLEDDFDPESSEIDSSRNGETWLSDDLLSDAGLSNVNLYATAYVVTEADTEITLTAGGSLDAIARRIYHQGGIYVPSGDVSFLTVSNKSSDQYLDGKENPDYVSEDDLGGPERIELAAGSTISAAGEQVNNHTAVSNKDYESCQSTALTDGGSITLTDNTNSGDGVVVRKGANLDVSGGYIIGVDEDLDDAGDAGQISLLGSAIVLEGTLSAISMLGQEGGTISLTAYDVTVKKSYSSSASRAFSCGQELPEAYQYSLIVDDDIFDGTGFTHISLTSYSDLTVEKGVNLEPSATKWVLRNGTIETQEIAEDDFYHIGDTSISLVAGDDSGFPDMYSFANELTYGTLTIEENTRITVGPQGSISLSGDYAYISGVYTAPGGDIDVSGGLTLLIQSDAAFYATGYNLMTGYYLNEEPEWDILDAGKISFESSNDLVMEDGAIVDVSSAESVTQYRTGDDYRLVAYTSASNPGSVILAFMNAEDDQGNSTINADFIGQKTLDTLSGASFTINHTDTEMAVSYFTLESGLVDMLENNGFETLNLTSTGGICFDESQTITMAEGIFIDTPVISGSDDAAVVLESSYVAFANTHQSEDETTDQDTATFEVNASYINISGDIKAIGFSTVYLNADYDIALSDYYYTGTEDNTSYWAGGFSVDNDLFMTAGRIYPTTASDFTLSAGGNLWTEHSGATVSDYISSALGSLTLEASNIYHYGYIAAPMGSIFLSADTDEGRVYLSDDSVLSVQGTLSVNYGQIDEDNLQWYGYDADKSSSTYDTLIEDAPEQAINILAAEIIAEEGSTINIQGGGEIYGYTFVSSTSGSMDPLSVDGRYVILPYSTATAIGLTGTAVYLEENDVTNEGVYIIVSDNYAFLDGALVIEYQSEMAADTIVSLSDDLDSEVVGYLGNALTGSYSSAPQIYTIMEVSDLLEEGSYEISSVEAGSAGSLSAIATQTNILSGQILADAVSDEYIGGTLTLVGQEVIIGVSTAVLGSSFTYDSQVDDDYSGTLYINAESVSKAGLSQLNIGAYDEDLDENVLDTLEEAGYTVEDGVISCETITIESGAELSGQSITLIAEKDIVLEKGAGVSVSGDNAYADIVSTSGTLSLADNSYIISEQYLRLEADALERSGTITAGTGISFISDYLYLADISGEQSISKGFVIDQKLWESLASVDTVWLTGYEEVGFSGKVNLKTGSAIVIDSPLVAGLTDSGTKASLVSDSIYLYNSSADEGSDIYSGNAGSLSAAADNIYIGYGQVQATGFSSISLTADEYLTFVGEGGFVTNDGNLNMIAGMVTGTYRTYTDDDDETAYEAVDFTIDSGAGNIAINSSGTNISNNGNIGGSLEFTGNSIISSGTVSLSSGYLSFTATGTGDEDGVFLENGALVSAAGSSLDDVDYDAGTVVYQAESGAVFLSEGSTTNVSASSANGDAGTIAIYATEGELSIEGRLEGSSENGLGGSFLLDALELSDLSSLIDTLSEGGINHDIDLRARSGDVSLTTDVTAYNFRLSVDDGNVSIDAVIDASGDDEGGLVEIYAGGDLILSDNTMILAKGNDNGAAGGEIILANATTSGGFMDLGDAVLNVSGGKGGTGGSIYLRVNRTDDNSDIKLNLNSEKMIGASEQTIEGAAFYQSTYKYTYRIKDDDFETDSTAYMEASSFILSVEAQADEGGDFEGFTIIPGVEFWYDGEEELVWYDDVDFTEWRFGSQNVPVALTLRSSGDLKVDGIIVDGPTSLSYYDNTLSSETVQDSMNITLVAGATLTSADPFAVESGVGNLEIDSGELVYTESGNINFASGGDTLIEKVSTSSSDYSYGDTNAYMTWNKLNYSIGTYSGTIRGQVGGNLDLYGGIIQTATGDIVLEVMESLYQRSSGGNLGTIRTLGELVSGSYVDNGLFQYDQTTQTSLYSNGGNISITTGEDVLVCTKDYSPSESLIDSDAWDTASWVYDEDYTPYQYAWSADYDDGTQGIVAMGGGDVTIIAGGDVLTAAGTFGTGDLWVSAGGNINGGYLNYAGTAEISSLGSIGNLDDDDDGDWVIEAFDSEITLLAQGNITLASVVNPSLTSSDFYNSWNFGYTEDTSVAMTARTGNITLTGDADEDLDLTTTSRLKILPGSVYLSAGIDIVFQSNFYLAPASDGSLELYPGENISAVNTSDSEKSYTILMSDADPDEVYGTQESARTALSLLTSKSEHGSSILHKNDDSPVVILAGYNIENIGFVLPKAATITAENDITNLYLFSQNLSDEDITLVYAGNDITFRTVRDGSGSSNTGITVGGPGLTVVQAGGNIDLGSSAGVKAVGSSENTLLKEGNNDLVVIAGLTASYAVEKTQDFFEYLTGFFEDLLDAGNAYVTAQNAGDTDGADAIVAEARQTIIADLLENASGNDGNISLINSMIYVSGGSGSINLVATGDLDVGVSAVEPPPIFGTDSSSSDDSSGIYTTVGGSINIYAYGDINVNESRVMTFDGGDIVLWSDYGDINAGYGSKAAVASSDFYYVLQDDGSYKKVYQVPAIGSGVRATASNYAAAGDIYAFAPSGIIDAGEAGIAGNNVTLAATEILNAQNIEVSGLAIGFTAASDSSGSVSGLSGSSGLADTAMMDEATSALSSAKDQMGQETAEGYSYEPRWVDVEVVGFEEDTDQEKG